MKICPECRTKNDDVNHFCKKCGFLMAGSWFKERKEEVSEEQKKGRWIFICLILIALVVGGVAFWIVHGRTTAHRKIAVQQKVKYEKIILEGVH